MKYRITILIMSLLFMAVVICSFERLTTSSLLHQREVGSAIQPFALSLGAVIAAIGGYGVIEDWLKRKLGIQEQINKWKKEYPIDKLGKDFEFIVKNNSDHIFVHDMKKKYKRHIANLKTMRKVWAPDQERKVVTDAEFNKIPTADSIDVTSP